ncbi:MAG: hypothetical protein U9R58_07035 [Chloroflexota bacterium]|nr:hypothetical protein [Chloroflexota bacterium]
MISPKAVHLIIQHFDTIDRAVSKRLSRKRPWSEPSLTSLLCDLMDQETQNEEKLEYSIENLNKDLSEIDGLLDVSFVIETHEYSPKVERWVTQSDIGFVINFEDHLLPHESWKASWLLQAKKLFPDSRNPLKYSEASRFQSHDSKQAERIEILEENIGIKFIKYLLFCPRPENLDEITQKKLTHLRNIRLSENIFDHTLGLELRDELSKIDSSLSAGLFISRIENYPRSLGAVHKDILNASTPFSWFIASHLVSSGFLVNNPNNRNDRKSLRHSKRHMDEENDSGKEEIVEALVKGQEEAIKYVVEMSCDDINMEFPILPPHTMTINIGVGTTLNSNLRQIRID